MAASRVRQTSSGLKDLQVDEVFIKLVKSSLNGSVAWDHFGNLYYKKSNKIVADLSNRYFCNLCLMKAPKTKLFDECSCDIKSYSSKIATSSLIKHIEVEHKISTSLKSVEDSTRNITHFFNVERNFTSKLKKTEIKFILIRDLVLLCCRDILPFSLVDGQGLRDFFEKYKVASVDDIPHRTSISRALTSVYSKAWLISDIKMNCPNTISITFDTWSRSDKYRRRSYITLTMHYINKNFELVNLTLGTNYFPHRHTGSNILTYVESMLDCYGLTGKTIRMITDGASNMKATCKLGSYEHLKCVGHALHNCVTVDGFKNTEVISELVTKVRNILKALRYRVSEFENLSTDQTLLAEALSDSSEDLSLGDNDEDDVEENVDGDARPQAISSRNRTISLKLDVKTRWHSILTMISTLLAQNKNVVNVMLHKIERSELILSNSEYQLLKQLKEFLNNFQRMTAIFSGEKYATLNYYVVFRCEIFALLEAEPQDSNEIKELKNNMMTVCDNVSAI